MLLRTWYLCMGMHVRGQAMAYLDRASLEYLPTNATESTTTKENTTRAG